MGDFLAMLADPQILLGAFTAIGVAATIFTVAIPFLEKEQLATRMKAVSVERDKIRIRERARMNTEKPVSLRVEPKAYMKRLVDQLQLKNALSDDKTADQLRMAGFRGQAPLTVFLFARFIMPFVCFMVALFYFFGLGMTEQPPGMKLAFSFLAAGVGMYLPNFYVSNAIQKRQQSIRRAWPDALDLMLICIESGMSVEPAFRKVAEEMGTQSLALAEEMSLTAAELSYLQERRKAYENLATRTGLEAVRAVVTALIQAERYGTPLGQAIRVLSQESRDTRMAEAEKKAASLPPKLTVPMIVFFLPVLFAVIIGPAMIQLFGWK
ncbi:type II secretion system F family protein [Siculibacillus lacustris]|uniref:Type II secretion system F family protein n=1 Tax=Siculibacillus lacustris TaxID=1549641 RepID=A0A4Q9VTZ9_9HYPH|nr:type II secretion system F family protein [Siculibacillus lacustris]TBW39221.1 type II secretion system F family protein [Siculibacillus lacustris]